MGGCRGNRTAPLGHGGLPVGLGAQAHLWETAEGPVVREESTVTLRPRATGGSAQS